ncbi:transmembrane protein 198 [Tribolium madens]|uniref:transmembrane protein 198 n=1 Tax=Tribolium madens TaxID=41895 RepID=UPI001CF74A15|nr:transmembrane protein 198 [Tribolium madens]
MSRFEPGPLVPPKPNGTRFPSLMYPTDPKVELCARIDTYYDLTTAAVFLVYIVFGILYTFLGYQCFKTVMFLTGFIFASAIVYLICLQGELMPSYGNAGVALLAGVLFGLITMLVQYVGLFVSGLHTGFLLGVAALLTADYLINTSPKGSIWLCVGVLLGMALIFAVLTLYFRKSLTIVCTSIYGGAIFSTAIDYFVERLSMISWAWQRVSLKPVEPPPCWFSWIVLAAWPSFFLTGLIVQCTVTGKGIHHEVAIRKKQRDPMLRGQTRAEMRQNKYRYLYQVRTAHGDVISRNFVQAMQSKEGSQSGGIGECSTLQSDATHLTILPDSQLAAYAESEDDSSQTEVVTHHQ